MAGNAVVAEVVEEVEDLIDRYTRQERVSNRTTNYPLQDNTAKGAHGSRVRNIARYPDTRARSSARSLLLLEFIMHNPINNNVLVTIIIIIDIIMIEFITACVYRNTIIRKIH